MVISMNYSKADDYFLAVLEEGSISKAASRLMLSQPYLSQYIKRLEKRVGAQLFDRSKSPIMLTPAGQRFYEYTISLSNLSTQLHNDIYALNNIKDTRLAIGLTNYRAFYLLPYFLPSYHECHPEIMIDLIEELHANLFHLIRDETLDFCLMNSNYVAPDITCRPVCSERILLVTLKSHIAYKELYGDGDAIPMIDLSLLKNDRFILLQPGTDLYTTTLTYFEKYRFSPTVYLRTINVCTAIELVLRGLGVTLIPESGLKMLPRNNELALFTIDDPPITWPMSITYKKDKLLKPYMEDFMDLFSSMILESLI